jgi:iron complex transport system substrate-binding protein
MAGCIEINKKQKNEKDKPFVTTSEVLLLNQSKIIVMDESSYNVTIDNIDPPRVSIFINSEENRIIAQLATPIEIDSDYDGRNELEINITKINPENVTIDFKAISSTSKFLYIEDDTKTLIRVPKKIDKIISLAASVTEILFELDQGNKIVGKDVGSNYPKECKDIDVVSTYEGLDLERILEKEPDIIIMDKTLDLSGNNYNEMTDFGLCVFRVYPKNLEEVLNNIELLGRVTGSEPKAEIIVNDLSSRIDTVKNSAKSISIKPRILHVIYYDGLSSPWVATTSTFSGNLIKLAGGESVVDDKQGFAIQITLEQLIVYDPEIIFTSQDDTWPTPSREAILNDEALSGIKAVKNKKVFDVNADIVDRPGPRLVDGLEIVSNYITA